jgi:hypothetical protein
MMSSVSSDPAPPIVLVEYDDEDAMRYDDERD